MAALQFITLHARFALKAIFLAALAAPAATGGLSAFAAPLRAPMSWARSSPGICRCSPVSTGDMTVGKAELINMGKDEQDVAKTSGLAMSLDSEAAEQSADDSDENDVEARLLATRKEFEEEREKKTEEKKDLYLQSLDGNFQRQTTHNYLSWIQADMETQESRRRRDDDFGETDDEAGGVREDGYVKKSPSKNTFKFFSLMPETLVAKATGKTEKVATWWDKLFGRRAVRKMRDSTWLDGLK